MLETLRKKGVNRTILWFLTIIIILSFGVFGVANYQDKALNSAGKIFGKSVSIMDFGKAYMDSRDQLIMTYGERFLKSGQAFDLEGEAWTRLILNEEVKRRRIKVEDKDVVEHIAQIPFFQSAGVFNQGIYENIVRSRNVFNRSVKDFEKGIQRTLAIKKLLDQVAGNVTLTPDELKKEYIKRHEKIKLTYVLLNPDDFTKDVALTDDEVKTFYEANKERFREPIKVNVEYVHILYPEKADDKQKQSVKNTIVAIAHELTPKADFAAIAAKHQQALKESGYFSQEEPLLTFAWSPEFVDKIFALKQGEISSPMEAPDGWQIVKIKEKKDSQVPELASIFDRVKEAALQEKAYAAAKTKAEAHLAAIKADINTKDFKTITTALGLTTQETESFSRGEYINAPGLIAEFQQDSYSLNDQNKLTGVIETRQGPAIAYLSSIEPIDEKQFEMDKEDFTNMVSAQKRNERIGDFITKLKLSANIEPNLKDKIRYR